MPGSEKIPIVKNRLGDNFFDWSQATEEAANI